MTRRMLPKAMYLDFPCLFSSEPGTSIERANSEKERADLFDLLYKVKMRNTLEYTLPCLKGNSSLALSQRLFYALIASSSRYAMRRIENLGQYCPLQSFRP